MSDPLIQVIYASAARKKLLGQELEQILAKARSFNTKLGITGLLIYHGGAFLQVLEGPESDVAALYEKIHSDNRHHKISLLLKEEIDEREFESWSMGFIDTTGLAKTIDGFVDYDQVFRTASTDKSVAKKVLRQFKDGIWRQRVSH